MKPVFIKVEITPEEHINAKILALKEGVSLQKWVGQAIKDKLKK
tara:strand:+ start:2785 stop:2916 length:132 start_codon:yes stop_codon:yes gene_type:complete